MTKDDAKILRILCAMWQMRANRLSMSRDIFLVAKGKEIERCIAELKGTITQPRLDDDVW